MIGTLTEYGRNAILDGTAMPGTLYLQHHTGAPGPDGTDNVSANGGRLATTRAAAVAGATTNVADLETNITTPETISAFSLHDAASGGNCWWTGDYNTARNYLIGDVARVRAGNLTYALS